MVLKELSDAECIGVGFMVDSEEDEGSAEWHGVGRRETGDFPLPLTARRAGVLWPSSGLWIMHHQRRTNEVDIRSSGYGKLSLLPGDPDLVSRN